MFRYTLRALDWLLGMGSHHRIRFNRAASYCWITEDSKLVDSDGNAPYLAVCKTAVLPFITTGPLKLAVRAGYAPATFRSTGECSG